MTPNRIVNLAISLLILFGIVWFISRAWKQGQEGDGRGNIINLAVAALMLFATIWLISRAWRAGQA